MRRVVSAIASISAAGASVSGSKTTHTPWIRGSPPTVTSLTTGKDASSPVRLTHRTSLVPIDPLDGDPHQDPLTTPAEGIVKSEPQDHWTAGRRVAAGRLVAAAAAAAGSPLVSASQLVLDGLPAPYDVLDGSGFDGRELWRRRVALSLPDAWFGAFAPASEP